MSRVCRIVGVALCCSCGGAAGPPRGPEHKVVNSEEAHTSCEKERKAAQLAREELLEFPEDGKKKGVADLVLAHGSCELASLRTLPIAGERHDDYLRALREASLLAQTAVTLFEESARYDHPPYRIDSKLQVAATWKLLVDRIAEAPLPAELEGEERVLLVSERDSVLQVLRDRALTAANEAQERAGEASDEEGKRRACEILKSLGKAHQCLS